MIIWQSWWYYMKFDITLLSRGKTFAFAKLESLNCPYYHELKILQNQGSFVEPIRKFELVLLWLASIFSKIREFLYHQKIWTSSGITSWNIPVLMKPFEHLSCPIIMRYNSIKCRAVLMMSLPLTPLTFPYYHKVKFSLNRTVLMSREKFICPYYHHIDPIMKFPRKIKPSSEIHVKI